MNDVEGAQKMGMKGILVQTGMARTPLQNVYHNFLPPSTLCVVWCECAGKYRDGDEERIHPAPWRVCQNFSHAVELILANVKDYS